MSKKVKVFIVMGQSNTLEMGKVGPADKEGTLEHAVKNEGLYPFLVDDEGNWTTRQDVRQVHVMQKRGSMRVGRNDFLTVKSKKIGIDLGIGHQLGNAIDEPVMVLRSSIGNRSLGWDLLPPGSERFEYEDPKDGKTYVYPGYNDEVRHLRWEKGNIPEPPNHKWYAGKQYDDDVANAKKILEELNTYYPDAQGYEIAGFLWWQGDKDRYNAGHAYRYGKNLATLIKALRKEFDAPDAKFVCATLGQTDKDNAEGNEKMILEGMMAVGNAEGEYSEFKGDVSTVYTHPLSMGSSSNAHYSGNAKTYMNVGLAMGEAMVDLLK
ncbi:sialate O-acetylesterase [Coraliomargarita sinensis]|uniref:Sialate O-acetylesterase n=2 Tax=Coraliomargarita sinensis TaxID=2174842 RepID=A0A317ZIB5_9BACT|nr:sialate O-acetylesterase [Coraliomargarita sinensis]